jgi:hypothetical protein
MFSASMQPLTVKTTSPFAALRIFNVWPTLKDSSAAQLFDERCDQMQFQAHDKLLKISLLN